MARKISFENITFDYKKENEDNPFPLFKKISFSIKQPKDSGYIVGLMGDSGSGKSTLLKLILRTERIWSGNIDIQPEDPIISYVPQEPVLFEHLTPLENAMYFSKTKRFKNRFDQRLFDDMVALLRMEDLLRSKKTINEISGGQKQRISLLRALSIKPDILLLDEPLTGLDERVKYSFLVDLAKSAEVHNILMIYITHYRQEIELISDEIVFLKTAKETVKDKDKEKVIEYVYDVIQKPTADFFGKPPTLSALYLSKTNVTNVLPVLVNSDGSLSLRKNRKGDGDSISFLQDVIRFDSEFGWEFEVLTETDSYLYLQLKENDSIIILPIAKKGDINEMHRILLNGSVDIYHNEDFDSTVRIRRNKIDNNNSNTII